MACPKTFAAASCSTPTSPEPPSADFPRFSITEKGPSRGNHTGDAGSFRRHNQQDTVFCSAHCPPSIFDKAVFRVISPDVVFV